MVSELFKCRIKFVLKWSAVVLLFLLALNYFRLSNTDLSVHKIISKSESYKNSEDLVEKLRPKLVSSDSANNSRPLWNDIGMALNREDVRIRDEGYKIFAFNTLVSSRIGIRRNVPDTRHKVCSSRSYSTESFQVASVVICFFHEEFWTLLRTVHSVIDRTPRNLLKEIILVNDQSDIDIMSNLTEHLKTNDLENIVKVISPPQRLGLIRARILGSRHATGDVLIFLDSHTEANVHWIEPLLDRLHHNRKLAVTPIIDIIDADTFEYKPSPLVRGGFNWGLNFRWDPIPKEELQTEQDFGGPFKSPTMAGGLFAINRQYFKEIGEYDPGLDVWGGENLELSFRLWMCGGSLEIVPCSRIGHVFRKRRPYGGGTDGEDSMIKNSLRVAKVWMDDYIQYYYQVNPHARDLDHGDVSQRIALRQELQCKDFRWYMENVYPDLKPPNADGDKAATGDKFVPWNKRDRNYLQSFMVKFSNLNLCVQSEGDASDKKSGLILGSCNSKSNTQVFYETERHELVLAKLLCLDSGKDRPRLMKCHELGGTQEWKFRSENRTAIYNMAAGLCLTAEEPRHRGAKIILDVCSENFSYVWKLIPVSNEL